jgi:hypothetical protein
VDLDDEQPDLEESAEKAASDGGFVDDNPEAKPRTEPEAPRESESPEEPKAPEGTDGAEDSGSDSSEALDTPSDAVGVKANAERLTEVLTEMNTPVPRGELMHETTMERDLMPPDDAKDALSYAVERKGWIMDLPDGYAPNR